MIQQTFAYERNNDNNYNRIALCKITQIQVKSNEPKKESHSPKHNDIEPMETNELKLTDLMWVV
jgi:hypothetical protein